ncbi:MAG: sulfurtransferase-like selenium metabolism protein YedF [Bacillota bacterium]|nr:sulfurtransferase-like selenium metabolism protein YedF [Bacillota bacterium]
MKKIDARGKQCPLPVIETKKALEQSAPGETVEVIVDNDIAVQNLSKFAVQKKMSFKSQKNSEGEFVVWITSGTAADTAAKESVDYCIPDSRRQGTVIVLSSDAMGNGDETLGKLLMKGFIYAVTKQDTLPETVIMYNGGAKLSCEGSESAGDLKNLEAQGVTVLTCGTCLNHYGLTEKLAAGSVTNMYDIAERLSRASLIIRP